MSEEAPLRIAYLTGEYPKVSHTFILREIEDLRALGAEVRTFSIREPQAKEIAGEEERAHHAETFYALKAAKNPVRLIGDHLAALAAAPGRYLSALKLALGTGQGGPVGLIYQLFYFAEAGVVARRLRKLGVGHIHNHFGDSSGTVTMLAAALAGVPYSTTLHGPTIFFAPQRWRLDEKIARAAFTVCISHFCRSQAMLFSDPQHWPKLKIVHCGVDPARYDAAREERGEVRFLFVGRLAAVKGVSVLLDAFAGLVESHPNIRLTLVGDGPERRGLEAAARPLGDRVEFTGYLSQAEVAERLRRADVFVLPSFAEGVPVALMEAMASRLPVIAPRVGGVQELVEDGAHGYVTAPGDVAGLAAAMSRLAADPPLRAEMGAAGRAQVEAGFVGRAEAAWLHTLFKGAAKRQLPAGLRPEAE